MKLAPPRRRSLTYKQKLDALGHRFYNGADWHPQENDYYTSSRSDLELYQIVKIENVDGRLMVHTRYCTSVETDDKISVWPMDEFLSPDTFGGRRVHVPSWVLMPTMLPQRTGEPRPGRRYRHQNGNVYIVTGFGYLEESFEKAVIYLEEEGQRRCWVRSVEEWCIYKDGQPRFTELP